MRMLAHRWSLVFLRILDPNHHNVQCLSTGQMRLIVLYSHHTQHHATFLPFIPHLITHGPVYENVNATHANMIIAATSAYIQYYPLHALIFLDILDTLTSRPSIHVHLHLYTSPHISSTHFHLILVPIYNLSQFIDLLSYDLLAHDLTLHAVPFRRDMDVAVFLWGVHGPGVPKTGAVHQGPCRPFP
jgi:hypothetical protein